MCDNLTTALDAAVKSMVSGKEIAVAFSGGLDSGLIAALSKNYSKVAKLYTVGIKDSYDVVASREMSQSLDMEWEHILIDEESLEAGLANMIKTTGTVDPITLSFEVPLMYILPHVGEEYVITGQGADEIFFGYSKYVGLSDNDLKDAYLKDVEKLRGVTCVHEQKMAERYGKTLLYPYLDEKVINAVSELSFEARKPTEEERKMPLRDVATQLGYPEIAEKPKKAAQYGSGAMNLIKHMAKKKSLTVSEYIFTLKDGNICD